MDKTRTGHKDQELRDIFNVSEDELDDTLQDYLENIEDESEKKKKKSVVNFPTVAGSVMLITAFIYFLQSMNLFAGPNLAGFMDVFAVLGVVLVALVGFGLFSRNRKKKKKSRKMKPGKSGTGNYKTADSSINDGVRVDPYGFKVKKRLMRSTRDKKLFGVCGGIADYFGLDSTLVRVIFVLAVFFYGLPLVAYLLMAIFMPKEPKLI
jgi:phage shock protein C